MNTQKISYLTLGITLINTALIGVVLFKPRTTDQHFHPEKTDKEDILSGYYKNREEALQDVNSFRTANVMKIPYSLQFDSEHLRELTNRYKHVRFYFGQRLKGTDSLITLLAVGVSEINKEDDKLINPTTDKQRTRIVEFADPCPVCSTIDASGGSHPQEKSLLFPFDNPNEAPKFITFYSKDACPK